MWVVPKRSQPGPWTFTPQEVSSFSKFLGDVVDRYNNLVDGAKFPYMMLFHAAPKGFEDSFHFHVEFCPPLNPAPNIQTLAKVDFGLISIERSLEETASDLKMAKERVR